MSINDEKIKEMFSEYAGRKDKEYYYFYGVVTASMGKTMLLGSLAAFSNKYYIVGINTEEIVLIGLGMTGKTNGYSVIPRTKVKKVKISSWIFGLGKKIYFTFEDGTKLKLKANKHCVGIKKQKDNLLAIEEMVNKAGYSA